MSRRTATRFALAQVLALTLVAPGLAQDPLIAPMPRPMADPPAWPEREQRQAVTNPFVAQEAMQKANGVCLANLKTVSPYEGTWAREVAGSVLTVTFTGNEMVIVGTVKADLGNSNDLTFVFTGTADCSTTKEGLVYGVVSGADVSTKASGKDNAQTQALLAEQMGATETATVLQKLVDAPFSFRARRTSAGLMVSNIKIGQVEGIDSEALALLAGRYTFSKDGMVPAAKPMQLQTCTAGMTLPSGRYLEHSPNYFQPQQLPPSSPFPAPSCMAPTAVNPACDVAPMPRPVSRRFSIEIEIKSTRVPVPPCCAFDCPPQGGAVAIGPMIPPEPPVFAAEPVPLLTPAPPVLAPAPTASVPPAEFRMMADTFGQMLGSQPSTTPVQPAGAMALPERAMVPCPLPPSARPSLTGTWVREVGPIVYVITITPNHLTVTATAACELDDGKIVSEGMMFTADYQMMQDGSAVVGLITSADAMVEGSIPPDTDLSELKNSIANLQKSLTDKPFALGVRIYGDTLLIGNVRMPAFKSQSPWCPLSTLGGRYVACTDKTLPKPKPMKPIAVQAGGPAGGYPEHVQPSQGPAPYFPPQPPPYYGPQADRIPPTAVAPAFPTANNSNPPLYRDSPRVVPVPAPAPAPAPTPEIPAPTKKRKKRAAAEMRSQQLSSQAAEMRQMQNEWKRFWFNDQPTHLTPERIHGAVGP